MSSLPFDRLFSMPAFEGLRILRIYMQNRPSEDLASLTRIIRQVESDAHTLDLDAALLINDHVPLVPTDGTAFYRVCLSNILIHNLPEWAKLVTLGRGRFIKRLKAVEFRDVRSLFRQARLLDEPPTLDDVEWWDTLQAHVRTQQNVDAMKRARAAEKLTLEYEFEQLRQAGLDIVPRWMSIEDNTVGYDVLSYSPGDFGPVNRLIEVKSTIASPLRFYVTRNEWESALEFGEAFVFHIWDLQREPPLLYERTVEQVLPHIPQDNEKGRWANAVIPVGIA